MTDTLVSSATSEVTIGFERPFVMIGERINPTGRRLLAEEMKAGDFSRVEADAIAQVAAGAQMLDVNAGIPLADEPALLATAVQLVQSVTDVPCRSIRRSSRRSKRVARLPAVPGSFRPTTLHEKTTLRAATIASSWRPTAISMSARQARMNWLNWPWTMPRQACSCRYWVSEWAITTIRCSNKCRTKATAITPLSIPMPKPAKC